MSNYNENSGMNDDFSDSIADNIVKLHVNGASGAVNTIEDQKTGKGRSLVCPFPSLEVDIPIRFTDSQGKECEGSIHRIGVEDDPETGLPKLRLSVRNETGKEDVHCMAPSEDLFADPDVRNRTFSELFVKPAEVPEEEEGIDLDITIDTTAPEAEVAHETVTATALSPSTSEDCDTAETDDNTLLDGLFDELPRTNTAELLALDDIDPTLPDGEHGDDPEWVSYADMPAPGALRERSQTRRRRRAIAVAAWMMVLGIAAGGIYVLGKAGVVNLGSEIGFLSSVETASVENNGNRQAEPDALEQLSQPTADAVEKQAPSLPAAKPALVNTSAQVESAQNAQESGVAASENAADKSVAEAEETETIAEAVEEDAASKEAAAVPSSSTEVVLPTRWPAEFATAYRLQNPNGVVVDVPGGLVKREGWLTLKEGDKIIRSIKAVQRENGARFIVYVHGNLPNFKTTPRSGGIRLSLYYDSSERASSDTQQVAMLDK